METFQYNTWILLRIRPDPDPVIWIQTDPQNPLDIRLDPVQPLLPYWSWSF